MKITDAGVHLLDILATAGALGAEEAAATGVAPRADSVVSAHTDAGNRLAALGGSRVARSDRVLAAGLVAVDADEVAAEVVLAAERAAAAAVGADVGLEAVRVVRRHVRLQVVCTGKGCVNQRWNRSAIGL